MIQDGRYFLMSILEFFSIFHYETCNVKLWQLAAYNAFFQWSFEAFHWDLSGHIIKIRIAFQSFEKTAHLVRRAWFRIWPASWIQQFLCCFHYFMTFIDEIHLPAINWKKKIMKLILNRSFESLLSIFWFFFLLFFAFLVLGWAR